MTDEHRQRIHAITYSTDDRVELAERIVKLEDERDLYSSLVEDMDHPDTANQLREENAKLRKLVKNLYECNGSCNRCVELMGKCEYAEQLREFGIEVEDD